MNYNSMMKKSAGFALFALVSFGCGIILAQTQTGAVQLQTQTQSQPQSGPSNNVVAYGQSIQTIRINGADISYVSIGAGEPVVLVHGPLGDLRVWQSLATALSRDYRVIACSLRGHFPNHVSAEGLDYSPAQHANDLAVLIQQLKLGPVHLIGHSYGGRICVLLAKQHPEVTRSLVLAEPSVFSIVADAPAVKEFAGEASKVNNLAQQLLTADDSESAARMMIDLNSGDGYFDRLDSTTREQMMANAGTIIPMFRSAATSPVKCEELQQITAPVLLVRGASSIAPYRVAVEKLAECLPNAEVSVIPGAGHRMVFDQPVAFNEAVLAFLSKLPKS